MNGNMAIKMIKKLIELSTLHKIYNYPIGCLFWPLV